MNRVTIQDVARELKMSRNTVAKALNNSDTVAYETRYLVIEKAYEMGYSKLSPAVVNEFNVKNSANSTKTIAVLVRRELSVFWNSILMGISDELNKHGSKMRFNFVNKEDEDNLILPRDLHEDVDAVIMLCVFRSEYVEKVKKKNLPMVFLDAPADIEHTLSCGDIVLTEGFYSVRKLTESLLLQGRKRIAFIGDITYCRTILDRYQGYMAAMKDAGIDPEFSMLATASRPQRYYNSLEVVDVVSGWKEPPHAVVCANDDIALDVIRYYKSCGKRIPQDIAVTGYDNVEVISSQLEPFLTTVRVGNQRLGKRLVQQIMWRLANPGFPNEIVTVNVELIFRESSRAGDSETK